LASDFVRRVVAPIRKFAGKNIDLPIRDQGRAAPERQSRGPAGILDDTMARRSWICPARAVRPRHPGPDLRIQRHESPGRFAALLEAVLLGLVRGQDQGRADVSGRDGRRRIIGVPPFFSPLRLDLAPEDFVPGTGHPGLEDRRRSSRTSCWPSDVYDSLCLETVVKRCRVVLVGDGGGKLDDDPPPATDWGRQTLRVMKLIDNGVRNLRKRQVIDVVESPGRNGA
jgi:NTE family protein